MPAANQTADLFCGILNAGTLVKSASLIDDAAVENRVPARGVQRAFGFLIVGSPQIEKMHCFSQHTCHGQLTDGSRAACVVQKKDRIRTLLDHVYFALDDIGIQHTVRFKIERSDVLRSVAERYAVAVLQQIRRAKQN